MRLSMKQELETTLTALLDVGTSTFLVSASTKRSSTLGKPNFGFLLGKVYFCSIDDSSQKNFAAYDALTRSKSRRKFEYRVF